MTPLLSVVIPTHNRSQYAFFAIRSILALNDFRVEVVVSDTSADDKLYRMLSNGEPNLLSDPRLKFFKPAEKLDMTGNHNAVIEAAKGEYVCLIGDDDTITLDAVNAASWALENNIEIIAPDVAANYAWPDFRSRFFGAKHSSRLYLPKKIGQVELHDSEKALESALLNAAQGTDGLPKIYHGIVKRDLLEKIKRLSGNYFYGSSPDVSGAIGLVLCSKSFVTVDYPLTIPGASGGSNTGRSALNQHKGKLSSESQTKSFERTGWSKGIPKFFSVETVWAHAALETIKKIDATKVLTFNYAKLIAVCKILHPEYKVEINQAINETKIILSLNDGKLSSRILFEQLNFRIKRFIYIGKRMFRPTAAGGRLFVSGLSTIEQTTKVLEQHMNVHEWNWNKAILTFTESKLNRH